MKRGSSRRLMLAPSSFAVAIVGLPLPLRHVLGGVLDGLHDIVIAGAGAEVAFQLVADVGLGGLGVALEELGRRHDHARGAEAALQPVLLPEPFLDRVELAVLRLPLDGRDLGAVGLHREEGARLHRLAVQMDGAGAALAGVATHMGPGEAGQLPDEMDEEQPGLHLVGMARAVDRDRDFVFHRVTSWRTRYMNDTSPMRVRGWENDSEPSPGSRRCQGPVEALAPAEPIGIVMDGLDAVQAARSARCASLGARLARSGPGSGYPGRRAGPHAGPPRPRPGARRGGSIHQPPPLLAHT